MLLRVFNYQDESWLPEAIKRQLYEGEPHPNSPPKNLVQITEKEFSQSCFFSEDAAATDWRQTQIDGADKPVVALRIFWYSAGHGIAITADYWAGKIRYFRCGCNHEWTQIGGFMFSHTYRCKNCQIERTVDSSG